MTPGVLQKVTTFGLTDVTLLELGIIWLKNFAFRQRVTFIIHLHYIHVTCRALNRRRDFTPACRAR